MIKLRFQGPPWLSLHHFTAFAESDSTISLENEIRSQLLDILIARWIASISALLMSILGMGVENRHTKCPWLLRSTPPIAALVWSLLTEASTFHLRMLLEGGDQIWEGEAAAEPGALLVQAGQCKHVGLRKISDELYGKGSPQPFIH